MSWLDTPITHQDIINWCIAYVLWKLCEICWRVGREVYTNVKRRS